MLDTEIELQAGKYTLAAVGEVCALSDEPLQIVTFNDNITPTEPDHARVRSVHASPDAPDLDITTDDGETMLADGLAFSTAENASLPAGEQIIAIRTADSGDIIARFSITAEAGHVYTAFATKYVEPETAPDAAVEDASFVLAITEDAVPGEA